MFVKSFFVMIFINVQGHYHQLSRLQTSAATQSGLAYYPALELLHFPQQDSLWSQGSLLPSQFQLPGQAVYGAGLTAPKTPQLANSFA